MSSHSVRLHKNFQKAAEPPARPKLQIVSKEPFSPLASFMLGMTAGLAAATGVFVLFLR